MLKDMMKMYKKLGIKASYQFAWKIKCGDETYGLLYTPLFYSENEHEYKNILRKFGNYECDAAESSSFHGTRLIIKKNCQTLEEVEILLNDVKTMLKIN